MPMRVAVSVGDHAVAAEGGEAFGAVRQVLPTELVIDIEGYGDVTVPAHAVLAVHDGKVVVDVPQLPAKVQRAVEHAHDQEEPETIKKGSRVEPS